MKVTTKGVEMIAQEDAIRKEVELFREGFMGSANSKPPAQGDTEAPKREFSKGFNDSADPTTAGDVPPIKTTEQALAEGEKVAGGESWQTAVVKNQLKKDGYWDEGKPTASAPVTPATTYSTGKSDRQIREERPDVVNDRILGLEKLLIKQGVDPKKARKQAIEMDRQKP